MKKFLTQALESNNTIIIPGFGALTITSEKTREIYFIPYLKHDDGTLSNIISTYNSEDIDSSKNFIKEFVENINESLEKNSLYELNEFGRFKKNKSGDIEFENWEEYNKIKETNKEKAKSLKNKEINNISEEELVKSKLDLETKNNDSTLDKIISNSENNKELFEQKIFNESNNLDIKAELNSLDNNDLNELDIKEDNDNNLTHSDHNNILEKSENSEIINNEIHDSPLNENHEDFTTITEESDKSNEYKEEKINDSENEKEINSLEKNDITNQDNEEIKLENIEETVNYYDEKSFNSKDENVIIDNDETHTKNENVKTYSEDLNNNKELINEDHYEEIDKIVTEKKLDNGSQKSKKKSIIPWIFVGLGISSGIVSYILYSRKNEIIILDTNSSDKKTSKNITIDKNKSKEILKDKINHNKIINNSVSNLNKENIQNTGLLSSQYNNNEVDNMVNQLNTDKKNSSLINNLNTNKIQTTSEVSTNSNITNINSSQNSNNNLSTQNNKPTQGKAGNKIELIAETFNDQSSAEKMVANLKDGGYKNARIEKKDNQYNVIIDSYNTLSETVKELNKYRGK